MLGGTAVAVFHLRRFVNTAPAPAAICLGLYVCCVGT